MELYTVWFILIGVLWVGYFVLEGFDFGVGMLLPVLGKSDTPEHSETRKRVMLNTIGPVWDGNEVWLLTAGGATFAAFPHWYATLFSGFYLPLLLILIALIIRALGFDYRGKRDSATWRQRWDLCIVIGSWVPAVLWGVAFANIVLGVPIDADKEFTGNLFTLLNPAGLLGGLTTAALFLTHGAIFTALKTQGPIREDARKLALKTGLVSVVLAAAFLLVVHVKTGNLASWLVAGLAAVALVGALLMVRADREGWAFIGTFAAIAFAVASMFLALYPDVMPSSTNPAYSLTVENASSTDYTLGIMTVVALIFTPVVLIYQSWTYWVFHKRIGVQHIPAAS